MVHAFNPTLRRQKQVDLCEFDSILVYKVSSRTVSAVTQRNPVSKNKQTNKQKILMVLTGLRNPCHLVRCPLHTASHHARICGDTGAHKPAVLPISGG